MKEYLLELDSEITGCHTCPLCNSGDEYSDDWFCEALHGERLEAKNKTGIRRGDCPLKEVPTHGDLIDKNELIEHAYVIQMRDGISFQDALTLALRDAPTVLEASRENS